MNKPWKEVTIYDIAEKLNISASTVSRALNNHPIIKEKTRKLVQATAEEMNFEFNALQSNTGAVTKHTIGVVLPSLKEDCMDDVVTGILDMSAQMGYDVIFSQSEGLIQKEVELVKEMFRKKVDGLLICLAYEKQEMAHFAKFQKYNVPICSFHKVWNHPYSNHIQINNFKAAHELATHLITEGCRRIAHITALTFNNIYQDRLKGYVEALNDHGLVYDEKLVFKTNLSSEAGEKVAAQITAMDQLPDGLMFNDDVCAVSCMNALKKYGVSVPGTLLITGFNNHIVSTLSEPALTTVDIQGYQMGQMALTQLVNQIKFKGTQPLVPFRMCLEHRVVIRASSLKTGSKEKLMKAISC